METCRSAASNGNTTTQQAFVHTFRGSTDFTGFSKVQDETPSTVGRVTQQPIDEGNGMLVAIHVDALPVGEDSVKTLLVDLLPTCGACTTKMRATAFTGGHSAFPYVPISGKECRVPISMAPALTPRSCRVNLF